MSHPGAFGYGDARLCLVLGLYLGFESWTAVYYGILGGSLGAGVAIVLLVARRANRRTAIAFGPILVLGALLVLAFDIAP